MVKAKRKEFEKIKSEFIRKMITMDGAVWKEGEHLELECYVPSARASMRIGHLC